MLEFETSDWRLSLPDDWEQNEGAPKGVLRMRSGDGSKGLYISTLEFRDDNRSANEILAYLQEIEMDGHKSMENARWRLLDATTERDSAEQYWGRRIDCYDASNSYRIQGKFLARLPVVVRANFHDYLCEDLQQSTRFFEPIILSLTLK